MKLRPRPKSLYILTAVTQNGDRVPVDVFTSKPAADSAKASLLRAQDAAIGPSPIVRYDIALRLAGA